MEWFEKLIGYQGDHPKDVALAYQKLQEELARQEGAVEDQRWAEREKMLRAAGISPAQSADPVTGAGLNTPGMTPLERWKAQVDGLINSGNPVLQKQGLDMMSAYQQRATTVPKSEALPTAYREWQLAAKQGYTGTFEDWKRLNKAEGVTINQGDKYIKASDQVFDSEGKRVSVPVGMTYDDARDMGWTFGQQATSEEAQQIATTESSIQGLERLRNVFSEHNQDITGLEGWLLKNRTGDTAFPVALNAILNMAGKDITPGQAEAMSLSTTLSNQLLDAIRGAQVGPQEQAIFERQLPMPGMDEKSFLANMVNTYRNLQEVSTRKAELRGTAAPDFSQDFLDFTYNGNDYRILPGGRLVKRKAKED